MVYTVIFGGKCFRTWACAWRDHQFLYSFFFFITFHVSQYWVCHTGVHFSFLHKNVRETRKEDGKQTPIMSHVLSINSRHSRLKCADTQGVWWKKKIKMLKFRTTAVIFFFCSLVLCAPFWWLSQATDTSAHYRLLPSARTSNTRSKNWSDENCLIDWINCACGSVCPSITRRRAAEQTTVWFCLISASHLFRSRFYFIFYFYLLSSFFVRQTVFFLFFSNISMKTAQRQKRLNGYVSTLYVIAIVYLGDSIVASCAVAAKKSNNNNKNASQTISHITHWTCVHFNIIFSIKKKTQKKRKKEKQIVEWRTRLGEQIKSSKSQPNQFGCSYK